MNDQNLCKKRELIATDATELAGYLRFEIWSIAAFGYCPALRYDAINKMIGMLAEEITVNKGRAAYAGKVKRSFVRKNTKIISLLCLKLTVFSEN